MTPVFSHPSISSNFHDNGGRRPPIELLTCYAVHGSTHYGYPPPCTS